MVCAMLAPPPLSLHLVEKHAAEEEPKKVFLPRSKTKPSLFPKRPRPLQERSAYHESGTDATAQTTAGSRSLFSFTAWLYSLEHPCTLRQEASTVTTTATSARSCSSCSSCCCIVVVGVVVAVVVIVVVVVQVVLL